MALAAGAQLFEHGAVQPEPAAGQALAHFHFADLCGGQSLRTRGTGRTRSRGLSPGRHPRAAAGAVAGGKRNQREAGRAGHGRQLRLAVGTLGRIWRHRGAAARTAQDAGLHQFCFDSAGASSLAAGGGSATFGAGVSSAGFEAGSS